jgi:hypothetical protein
VAGASSSVGLAAGSQVFGRLGGDGASGWESVEAYDRLSDVGEYGARLTAVVDGRPVSDPVVRSAVERLARDLESTDGVARVVDPYRVPLPDLRATDGRALAVAVDLAKDLSGDRADEVADAVERRLRATAGDAPGPGCWSAATGSSTASSTSRPRRTPSSVSSSRCRSR